MPKAQKVAETSNSVAVREERPSILARYSQEEIAVLKSQILYPAVTDEEMAYFDGVCHSMGIDPLEQPRLIYGIPRKQDGRERLTIQLSVDWYTKVAIQHGDLDYLTEPQYLIQRAPDQPWEWDSLWMPGWGLSACTIGIKRKGASKEITYTVRRGAYEVANNPFWQAKPDIMLAAAATRLALKRSGAIYAIPEEWRQMVGAEEARFDPATGEVMLSAGTRNALHAGNTHAEVHQAVIDTVGKDSLRDCTEDEAQMVLETLKAPTASIVQDMPKPSRRDFDQEI